MVRVTVHIKREANTCAKIQEELFKKGYNIPICAYMHFHPVIAQLMDDAVEKIFINPGNFTDGWKEFEEKLYKSKAGYF